MSQHGAVTFCFDHFSHSSTENNGAVSDILNIKIRMTNTFIFISFLLIYFLYFYVTFSKSVLKPQTPRLLPKSNAYKAHFTSKNQNEFQFEIDKKVVWKAQIPESYRFYDGKIVEKDICQSVENGHFIAATGQTLYDYLKKYPKSLNEAVHFKHDTAFTLQEGHVFYFSCQNGRIHQIHMCQSGETFVNGACQPITMCTGKSDGSQFPDPLNVTQYTICENQHDILKKCPENTFYLFDSCKPMDELVHYCNFFTEPFLLDSKTRGQCIRGKLIYTVCEPGYRFFNTDRCEPAHCDGQPDNAKLPLSERENFPFRYIPGYYECQGERVQAKIECPEFWDPLLSKGDNLTHLPMVFDGRTCSIPTFCENVTAVDTHVFVPRHEYSKYIMNWSLASVYDQLGGYQCERGVKRPLDLAPGERIGKKFKRESACDDPLNRALPVSGFPDRYFDCQSQTVIPCDQNEQFDGTQCAPKKQNAAVFTFKDMEIFQFQPLDYDGWIKPWKYSKLNEVKESCVPPEDIFLRHFNICSHKECVAFPFLSQIPSLAILLQDGHSKCVFDTDTRKLSKKEVHFKYNFWNQRSFDPAAFTEETACKVGQKIQTGNFIWDNVIYATCNDAQPFVFCPSPLTKDIVLIDEKQYACQPPSTNIVPFSSTEWTAFEKNEIKRILPAIPGIPHYFRFNENAADQVLPEEGIEISNTIYPKLLVKQPVFIEYNYRVNHPPDVAIHENNLILSKIENSGFLIRVKDFTLRTIDFPVYSIETCIDLKSANLYTE